MNKIWVVAWIMEDDEEGPHVWVDSLVFTDKEKAHEFAADRVAHYKGVTVAGLKLEG